MDRLVDNRYEIVRPLGSGGVADVYLVHDEVLDRDVALKMLNRERSGDEEFVERFRREARSAAALSHPNIAPRNVRCGGPGSPLRAASPTVPRSSPIPQPARPPRCQRDRLL